MEVAWTSISESGVYTSRMQVAPCGLLRHAHSLVETFSASSADSGRASCQLLAKQWALNVGQLAQEQFG